MKGSRDFRKVFVIGSPRSGTTVVGNLLGTHPEIAYFGEFFGFFFQHHYGGFVSQENSKSGTAALSGRPRTPCRRLCSDGARGIGAHICLRFHSVECAFGFETCKALSRGGFCRHNSPLRSGHPEPDPVI